MYRGGEVPTQSANICNTYFAHHMTSYLAGPLSNVVSYTNDHEELVYALILLAMLYFQFAFIGQLDYLHVCK